MTGIILVGTKVKGAGNMYHQVIGNGVEESGAIWRLGEIVCGNLPKEVGEMAVDGMKVRKWTECLKLTRGKENQSLLKMVQPSVSQKSKFHFSTMHVLTLALKSWSCLKFNNCDWYRVWLKKKITNFENSVNRFNPLYKGWKILWPRSHQRAWARTGQEFSSSFPFPAERLRQTMSATRDRARCAGKRGCGSWILERAVIHCSGCSNRRLFLRGKGQVGRVF